MTPDTSSVRSGRYRPMFKAWFAVLVIDFVVLMWCGSQVPSAFTGWVGLIASTYWFAYFLVILPLLGRLERPLPLPESIARPVLRGGGPLPAGAFAKPMEKA